MAGAPLFLHHRSSLEHDPGPHPEQPARISAILEELEQRDWLGYQRRESTPVGREVLSAVHPESYVAAIERIAERGGGQLDMDTAMSAGSFTAALHAAGGAVQLASALLEGGAGGRGFSAHRPPGHHAMPERAMGFCLFNNIAVAARHAVDALGADRVMVIDWDVHHCNGTAAIFYECHEVLVVSIHQWPLYPGTGAAHERGRGPGEGFTVNLPVPAGSGDGAFLSLVGDVAVPLARSYAPNLVLISAGFDAHRDDPLASCTVTEAGFAGMAALVSGVCDELGIPVGCVLEGGYDLGALARSVAATMEALAGAGPERVQWETHPLAVRAHAGLSGFWRLPALQAG